MRKIALVSLLALIPMLLAPGVAGLAGAQEPSAAAESAATAPPPTTPTAAPATPPSAAAPAATAEDLGGARTLAEWYALGGWVMHFIVACSMISFALVLERAWSLRSSAVVPKRFLREIAEHWHKREIPDVLEICHKSDTSLSRVLRSGLLLFDQGLARMEDAISAQGAHETTVLRRNLPVLAAVANIATMFGLLGTVLGMIESFDLIARTGTGDARVVASGIFEALVTTAAGLMVGIFTIAFHSYFRRRVEGMVIRLEDTSIRMLEDLSLETEVRSPRSMGTDSELSPAGV